MKSILSLTVIFLVSGSLSAQICEFNSGGGELLVEINGTSTGSSGTAGGGGTIGDPYFTIGFNSDTGVASFKTKELVTIVYIPKLDRYGSPTGDYSVRFVDEENATTFTLFGSTQSLNPLQPPSTLDSIKQYFFLKFQTVEVCPADLVIERWRLRREGFPEDSCAYVSSDMIYAFYLGLFGEDPVGSDAQSREALESLYFQILNYFMNESNPCFS